MKSSIAWASRIIAGAAAVPLLAPPLAAAELNGVLTYKTTEMVRPSPVVSALVSASSLSIEKKLKWVTKTNERGEYAIKDLPSGRYVIIIEKDGRRVYQGSITVEEPSKKFDIQL